VRSPLWNAAAINFFLSFLIAYNLRGRCRSSPDIETYSTMARIYKIWSEIWGPLPKQIYSPQDVKIWGKFRATSQLIANISGTKQDVVEWKAALQTAISPAYANLIWGTLVYKWQKIGPEFRPIQRAGVAWVVVKVHRVKLCSIDTSHCNHSYAVTGWLKMQDIKLTDQFSRHLQGMKLQDVKMKDQHAGHEIVGHENDRPNVQGIKVHNPKMQDMKLQHNEIAKQNSVRPLHYYEVCSCLLLLFS